MGWFQNTNYVGGTGTRGATGFLARFSKHEHRWSTNEKKVLNFLWVIHLCSSPLPAASLFCLQLEDTKAHLLGGPERKLRNGSAQGQAFQVGHSSVHTVKKKKERKEKRNVCPHCQACAENKPWPTKTQSAVSTCCSLTLFHPHFGLRHFEHTGSDRVQRCWGRFVCRRPLRWAENQIPSCR